MGGRCARSREGAARRPRPTGGPLRRRTFIGGLLLGAAAPAARPLLAAAGRPPGGSFEGWEDVRALFDLDEDRIHLAALFLASHPRPVRDAIARHRRGLDRDPVGYLFEHDTPRRVEALAEAAEYLGASSYAIALTRSTTEGLALLYAGLRLEDGDEIVTTNRDYYSTVYSLRYRARRSGVKLRIAELRGRVADLSADAIVEAIRDALTPRTRAVALTWVHSDTGLRIPLREIADAVADENRSRGEDERILVCVDGVHGFGVEDVNLGDLGCDFLATGCHKWLFGPRGTGVVYAARPELWDRVIPTVPPFGAQHTPGLEHTPGGFHAFEHRWALAEAFRLHRELGKGRIAERTHALADQLKEGLAELDGVVLHTPRGRALSAGIVAFGLAGIGAAEAVGRLRARGISVTQAPYGPESVRAAPSIVNTPEEIERTLRAVRELL